MSSFQTGGFQMLPPIVKNLLIINVLMFLAMIGLQNSLGYDLNDILGLHWVGAEKFRWYQVITYMFMHANFNHILFNMFAVWMFGNAIENVWGSKRFLVYYLLTGIGAAALHYGILYFETLQDFNQLMAAVLESPDSRTLGAFFNEFKIQIFPGSPIDSIFETAEPYIQNVLMGATDVTSVENTYAFMETYNRYFLNLPTVVGASGSLFGILLAFGMMFPNAELFLIFIPIPIKAKFFVAGYGAIELFSGLMNNSGDNVAHFAHLGGLITGYILIRLWQKFDPNFRLL
jgi:membrane associated rhomboid family serine protease